MIGEQRKAWLDAGSVLQAYSRKAFKLSSDCGGRGNTTVL
jgi:hypothetical protein